jgi:hypothetical protein
MALEGWSTIGLARASSTSAPAWAHLANDVRDADSRYSWFERRNRINVRDMMLIERLDEAVGQVAARKNAPVVIASGQMGMVAYHIASRHYGRVRFVDRHALVERSLTDCSATPYFSKDTGGLVLPMDRYLEHLPELERRCNLPRPDIVFDIGSSHAEKYGYRNVYVQSGEVTAAGTRLTGLPVAANAFIAVDERSLVSSDTPSLPSLLSAR